MRNRCSQSTPSLSKWMQGRAGLPPQLDRRRQALLRWNAVARAATKLGRARLEVPTVIITVNGERREVPEPLTVADLLRHLDVKPEHVAVEVNNDLVTRSRHAETRGRPGRRPGGRHPGRRRGGPRTRPTSSP